MINDLLFSISVLGAGSWGSALAILLARKGIPTMLWGRDAHHIARLQKSCYNERYLPGVRLPKNLAVTADLAEAVSFANDLLISVPSVAFRACLNDIKPFLHQNHRIAWATKGIELSSGQLLHRVVEEVIGLRSMSVISGPTFSSEVVQELPTAVTVAANEPAFAQAIAEKLHTPTFRAYYNDDLIGVELGGALKNVLAIAAGITDGLGFGANTRAALITRGLAEMTRLGTALGGKAETFMGLAGLGDLVLTATDNQSRNRRFGLLLTQGRNIEAALAEIGQAVEGYPTAREAVRLANQQGIEIPIMQEVYRVLYEGISPKQAVHNLLQRDPKAEWVS